MNTVAPRASILGFIGIGSLLALLGVSGPARAQTLYWGADAEGGAPYVFKDPVDPEQNIGFEVELAAALSRELGQPIEFRQYNYDSLVVGLERGDFDFAMNGLESTPDRQTRLRLSRPYYRYRLQLVVRNEESRFGNLEQCKAIGGIVGTLGDTAASRMLEARSIPSKVYDGQAEPYQDLELGRIDAVLLDEPIAVYYALPNPKLRFLGEPFAEGQYAIAFRKDQEALATRFDEALTRLERSGELRRIAGNWETPTADVLQQTGRALTFARYFPLLCSAAWVTIRVSVLSMALAMAIGLPVALLRLYGPAPLQGLAIGYVEFFRGIPVLLLLYLLYYGIPSLFKHYGIDLRPSDFTVAILAFGLNYAAYEAEIYRAGIAAVPRGQWEAAASLGMSPSLTFQRIILPQALRMTIPPMTNDFVALFKDTSLVSVIAIVELTKQYQILAKSSLKYTEIGLATAALYLIMSVPLGHLARHLEKRWGKTE
ncbi:MAG: ABC transporter substrate-binding protein/permease [Pirellulaceae bacterium]